MTATATVTAIREPSLRWIVAAYVGAIVAGEVAFAFVGVVPGVAVHTLVVVAAAHHLLVPAARSGDGSRETFAAGYEALVALPLVSLLRILSVTMPVDAVAERHAHLLVGAPLLLAAFVAARALGIRRLAVQVFRWAWRVNMAIAATGVPLGLFAFLLARPDAVATRSWVGAVVAVVSLAVFVAATEELLFRGVVQASLVSAFGRLAFVGSGVLSAAVYLGVRPASYAALMAAVGFVFGWLVLRYRALAGVTAAHVLLTVGSMLVWPAVLR